MLQCGAVWCSVLQCVALCCSVLQCDGVGSHSHHGAGVVQGKGSVLQCVAVGCGGLRCVAVCCSVLQCVAVCCSVLQCIVVCSSVAMFCSVLVLGVTVIMVQIVSLGNFEVHIFHRHFTRSRRQCFFGYQFF